MTVHKSKGLEFHTVFLPELQDKQFPVGNVGGKKYWSVLGGDLMNIKNMKPDEIIREATKMGLM